MRQIDKDNFGHSERSSASMATVRSKAGADSYVINNVFVRRWMIGVLLELQLEAQRSLCR